VQTNSAARIRLFCFPYAGGGSAIFRSWSRQLPGYIEVVPALLPGRELRLRESAYTRVDQLVDALAREITPYLDKPFAFFGHSMGAILSFELARRLRSEHGVEPEHLFISGRRSPRVPRRDLYIHHLPDAEFVAEIEQLNGTPREVLEHQELMEMVIPMLRADFAVCHSYTYVPGEPLSCPITVLSGIHDDTTPREEIEGWHDETTGNCRIHMLEGDHFFLNQQQATILPIITRAL
jgi:medium-chain acyl-[acyl-carrier-protein] hydrolase